MRRPLIVTDGLYFQRRVPVSEIESTISMSEVLLAASPVYSTDTGLQALWTMRQGTGENAVDEIYGYSAVATSQGSGPWQRGSYIELDDASLEAFVLDITNAATIPFTGTSDVTLVTKYAGRNEGVGANMAVDVRGSWSMYDKLPSGRGFFTFMTEAPYWIYVTTTPAMSTSVHTHFDAWHQNPSDATVQVFSSVDGVKSAVLSTSPGRTLPVSQSGQLTIGCRSSTAGLTGHVSSYLYYVAIFDRPLNPMELGGITLWGIQPKKGVVETLGLSEGMQAALTAGLTTGQVESMGIGESFYWTWGRAIEEDMVLGESLTSPHLTLVYKVDSAKGTMGFGEYMEWHIDGVMYIPEVLNIGEDFHYGHGVNEADPMVLTESFSWWTDRHHIETMTFKEELSSGWRMNESQDLAFGEVFDFMLPGMHREELGISEVLTWAIPRADRVFFVREG